MPIENLQQWADNVEIVRLPALESGVGDLQGRTVVLESTLSSKSQEFTDRLDAHAVNITAAQAGADSAQAVATVTSSRVYDVDLQNRIYTDTKVQQLRDELTASINAVNSYLTGPLEDVLSGQVNQALPDLQAALDAKILEAENLLGQLQTGMGEFNYVSGQILNTELPAQSQQIQDIEANASATRDQIDAAFVGYPHQSLLEGLNYVEARAASNVIPLGSHILKAPAAQWTQDSASALYEPKLPALPAWFVTDDAIFVDCAELPDGGNLTIGQAYPVEFDPTKVYRVTARVRTVNDGALGGVDLALGISTWLGHTAIDLNQEKPVTETSLVEADGEVTFVCHFSTNEALMIDQGFSLGSQATDDGIYLPGSGIANKAFFHIRQNATGLTNGQIRIASLKIEDVTEAFKASRSAAADASVAVQAAQLAEDARALANLAADAAEVSKVAAESARSGAQSSETNAAQSETNAAGSASVAASSAQNAANSETASGQSASASAQSASAAQSNATDAAQHANAAQASQTAAETAGASADISATEAANSATTATVAASSAQSAESLAVTARNEAQSAATAAATAETNAEAHATDAAQSAGISNTERLAAETAASSASVSAGSAAQAVTDAQGFAAAAATSETNVEALYAQGSSEVSTLSQAVASVEGHLTASYSLAVIAGQEEAGLQVVASDDPTETGVSSIRMFADNILLEGSVTVAHLEAGVLSADNIVAGTMSVSRINVDDVLSIDAANAGFSMGKIGAYDQSNDGIYMGRTLESNGSTGFGLAATKTTASGTKQNLSLTEAGGLKLINATHFRDFAIDAPMTTYTIDQEFNLDPQAKFISFNMIGGGSGGTSGYYSDPADGTPGGDTIVELLDGTTVVATWTATGGVPAPGANTTWGENKAEDGAFSVWGNGGLGGNNYHAYYTGGEDSVLVTVPATAGAHATGYGAGGGGGGSRTYQNVYSAGGHAGEFKQLVDIDLSQYNLVTPKIRITIGAGSPGQVSLDTLSKDGGNGSPGRVDLVQKTTVAKPADVVPIAPTASGTMSNQGPFPDLGAGLWVLSANLPSQDIGIGEVELDDGGLPHDFVYGSSVTFMSSKTPILTSTSYALRTLTYAFYKMGQ